jgi:dihydropyrimidinase
MDPALSITRLRPGVADLETMLPVLYSEGVRAKKITLERFVAVTSTNAAKLFGFYPRKGAVAAGSHADLALWDPSETRRVRKEGLFSRAAFSLYEGREVTGWPKMTIRRGEVAYEEGRITVAAGSGRPLLR